MRLLLAIIIAAGASGCATVPYEEASQAPDWGHVVDIRKQELARAESAAETSCNSARKYSNMAAEAGPFWGSIQEIKDLVSTSRAECMEAENALEWEKAMYMRMLDALDSETNSIDVYHY